ncbi:hypothetical protein NL500_30710, partial [Klebsiella pneumoniae]|nr:hypothetical protein [Klebsiella pneumoniae]
LNVMDDEKGSNEPFVRTGSGRVKTLRQQFEIGVNKNSSMSSKTEDMIVNVPKKIKRHSNISQKYNTCNKEPIPKQNNTSQ